MVTATIFLVSFLSRIAAISLMKISSKNSSCHYLNIGYFPCGMI